MNLKNIDNQIQAMKSQIAFKQNLINRITQHDENDKELIEILQEAISDLNRKVTILEEKKKMGRYIPKRPTLGDDRYKHFSDKMALDILRVLYYEFFHKDPSLSHVRGENAMFEDITLSIFASVYLIREEFPFYLMLTSHYSNYAPQIHSSIGIKFSRKYLEREQNLIYLKFMSTLIKRYASTDINLICCDGMNQNCTLAYIAENDFYHYTASKDKMYYAFFSRLCDNNLRNIVYIGDTMKQNAKVEEIEKTDSQIVIPHIEFISENLGIKKEELMKSNEELRNQVFTLRKYR